MNNNEDSSLEGSVYKDDTDAEGSVYKDDDDDAEESIVSLSSSLQLDELMPSSLLQADPSTSLDAVPHPVQKFPDGVQTTPVVFIGDVHEQASNASGSNLLKILGLAGGDKSGSRNAAAPPQTPQRQNDVEDGKVANGDLNMVLSNADTEPESPDKQTSSPLPVPRGGAAAKTACCNRRGYAIMSSLALLVLVVVVPLIVLDVGGGSSSSSVMNQEQGTSSEGDTIFGDEFEGYINDGSPGSFMAPSPNPSPAPVTIVLETLEPTLAPTDAPVVPPTLSPTSSPSVSASPTPVPSSGPSDIPSGIPSSLPSATASDTPTFSPSEKPSLLPSGVPSLTASDEPSSFPSPTPTSPFPTRPPLSLVDILSTVTPIEALQNTTTAQYAALRWLETVDGRQERTEAEILQRYALTVLDFSLRPSTGRRLASNLNEFFGECSWSGVVCGDNATVTSLNWANSGLEGELPAEMGLLRNLTHLDLAENQIGGSLPDALYELTELESLYLHRNNLTGTISPLIENVYGLVNLYLSNNELTGVFPTNLGSLGGGRGNRPLRILTLHKNKLSGSIPSDLNLRFLYYLDLSDNEFSGRLPDDWGVGNGAMVRIRHFHVDNNRFTGSIPATYPEMGNGRIEQFTVNDNSFVGTVPGDWPLQNHMSTMELQNNFFTDLGRGVCDLIVFLGGEVVNFEADCEICGCRFFCDASQCY